MKRWEEEGKEESEERVRRRRGKGEEEGVEVWLVVRHKGVFCQERWVVLRERVCVYGITRS